MESVVGGYRVLDKVGHGGFGAVWRARSPQGDLVALKMLHPQFTEDPEQVARLVGEFTLTTRLRHPNIVRSRALVSHGTAPVLVMDFVEGASLADELRARSRLPMAETLDLVRRLASALDRAHGVGIVHRDVKPANVLLEPTRDGVVPRLVDFGIALLAGSSRHTASGQIIGTPSYLAPEVIRGADPTPATDVYALGLLVHECATGEGAFGRGNAATLLARHLDTAPALPADWPEPVRALVGACLAKDPAARPTARDVAAALADPGVKGTSRMSGPLSSRSTKPVDRVVRTGHLPSAAGATQPMDRVVHAGHLPSAAGATESVDRVVGAGHRAPAVTPTAVSPAPDRGWDAAPVEAATQVPGPRRRGALVLAATALATAASAAAVTWAVLSWDGATPASADADRPTGQVATRVETGGQQVVVSAPPVPPAASTTAPGTTGSPAAGPAAPGGVPAPPAPGAPRPEPGGGDVAAPVAPPAPRPTTSAAPAPTPPPAPAPRVPVSAVSETDVLIVDANGRVSSSSVSIAAPGVVVGAPGVAVTVDIEIDHAKRGDLNVVVVAPNGRRHTVLTPNPRDKRTGYSARLDITAALPAGTPVGGTWRLEVGDHAAGNFGRIDRWGVTA